MFDIIFWVLESYKERITLSNYQVIITQFSKDLIVDHALGIPACMISVVFKGPF